LTLRCLEPDLVCSSHVVVCPTTVPVSLVSKRGNPSYRLSLREGKIPTIELDLHLLLSGGTSHQGAMKLGL